MISCDLNCDMGEGIGNDAAIMPYITSANIACGYHAGDEDTMRTTVLLANAHGVAIGAHPSFADRENFGRTEIKASATEVYVLVKKQLEILRRIVVDNSATLHHVKPHGALYNMATRDATLAKAIVTVVKDFDASLILYGLSGSYLISEAQAAGLKTASEVFADRSYQDDGTLTPRTQANALIEKEEQSIQQVVQMVKKGTVTTVSGKEISIVAETICLHGDGKNAAGFAKAIYNRLNAESIEVRTM
jgi:UPF0271 protein